MWQRYNLLLIFGDTEIEVPAILQEAFGSPVEISPKKYANLMKILTEESIDLNQKTGDGYTLLMVAIILQNNIMVELLLEHELDLDIKSDTGFRAIDYAMENKTIRTMLFKKGAKLDKIKDDQKSQKQIKKEIEALENPGREMLADTFKEAHHSLSYGTPLSAALKSKKMQDLQKAIRSGSNFAIVDIIDLVLRGYSAKFMDLVLQHGANTNKQDKHGKTAIMHACELGKIKMVEVLIRNRASITITDNDENDVWYYAALSGKEKIRGLLNRYEELSALSHNPKSLVKILSNFTIDTPIKYTTHIWDFDLKKEYGNFDGFITKVEDQWSIIANDLNKRSTNLYTKVEEFLGIWKSAEGLREWCNGKNDPFEYNNFGADIQEFKQQIEIRRDANILEKIFLDIEESFDDEHEMEAKGLKGKQFYTDTENLKKGLKKIFHEILKREEPKIIVEAIDNTGEFIELSITHINSFSDIDSETLLAEAEAKGGGDFYGIKGLFQNLCDWSVENSYKGHHYRINYLQSDESTRRTEELRYKPKGFTHTLRFYK